MKMINLLFVLALLISCEKKEDPVDPVDPLPELSIFDVSQVRDSVASMNFRFFVNVSRASDKDISVSYATNTAGTAIAGTDFIAVSGVLNIPAGQTLGVIDVAVPGSKMYEPAKTFFVVLSNPVNAVITGTGKGTGTISSPASLQPVDPTGYNTPMAYPGYTLVWHDEFDTSINPENWTHELGASGWGNNELQNYTASSSNSYIANGSLVIEAKKENNGTYTSARMITAGKKTFKYGRIDIRAKLPKGQGIWPALWMLGSDIGTVGWPACGEIDIMELIGHQPATLYGTAHWGAQGSGASQYSTGRTDLTSGTFNDKFHVFTIIWEENKIRWYLDDALFHTVTTSTTGGIANYRFNHDFFFIFNVAVGGNWPGYPDASTQFPQKMFVDYVRVFQ